MIPESSRIACHLKSAYMLLVKQKKKKS
uniref:Uncharacterized protein n=1 Tax=Anguilla anguilla TaxID=7936 RepID=A0A0E9TCF6_ANGAN